MHLAFLLTLDVCEQGAVEEKKKKKVGFRCAGQCRASARNTISALLRFVSATGVWLLFWASEGLMWQITPEWLLSLSAHGLLATVHLHNHTALTFWKRNPVWESWFTKSHRAKNKTPVLCKKKKSLWKVSVIISTLMITTSCNKLVSVPLQVSLAAWAARSVCSFLGCSMFGKGSWRCQWTAGRSVRSRWAEPASLSRLWNTPTPARCTSSLSSEERYLMKCFHVFSAGRQDVCVSA